VIWVALTTVNKTGVLPNLTEVTPVKLAPVIVTSVPPLVVPVLGEIDVTTGAAAKASGAVARIKQANTSPDTTRRPASPDAIPTEHPPTSGLPV
jgi:hypothetical protein